jgi:hypothetical protein
MTTSRILSLVATVLVLLGTARTTAAQDGSSPAAPTASRGGGIGLGVGAMLEGPRGLSFAYDGGVWHLDALFGATSNGDTTFGVGVRGWFHLHSGAAADFSLGGGVGFARGRIEVPLGRRDRDVVNIEVGLLVRAFVVSNVALSTFGGIALLTGDADGFRLGGQLLGGIGITYFFQ